MEGLRIVAIQIKRELKLHISVKEDTDWKEMLKGGPHVHVRK